MGVRLLATLKRLAWKTKFIWFCLLMFSVAIIVLLSGFQLPTAGGLILFISAILADDVTTYICLKLGGTEGNPVVSFLFRKIRIKEFRIIGTFVLMGVLWALIIYFRWLPASEAVQTAIACAYWLVPINNILVIYGYWKKHKSNNTAVS